MTPATRNISFKRGDSHDLYFRLREQIWDEENEVWVNGDYINFTGWTVAAQLRDDKTDVLLADFVGLITPNQDDPLVTGSGVIRLLPAATKDIEITGKSRKGFYDAQFTSPEGEVITFFEGTATIKRDATRD